LLALTDDSAHLGILSAMVEVSGHIIRLAVTVISVLTFNTVDLRNPLRCLRVFLGQLIQVVALFFLREASIFSLSISSALGRTGTP